MKKEKLLPIGKQLQKANYAEKHPFSFVVSKDEFRNLQTEKAVEVSGLSYEYYCEIEKEGWLSMFQDLFYDDLEHMNLLPKTKSHSKIGKNMRIKQALGIMPEYTNNSKNELCI